MCNGEKNELLFWCHYCSCTLDLLSLESYVYVKFRGHSHIKPSDSLCQNDAKFQTHPPSTLHIKIPNLLKIDVYNFRYKISVGILMKLFFLSHNCINKSVHKSVHKFSFYIHALSHSHFGKLQVIIRLKC